MFVSLVLKRGVKKFGDWSKIFEFGKKTRSVIKFPHDSIEQANQEGNVVLFLKFKRQVLFVLNIIIVFHGNPRIKIRRFLIVLSVDQ